MLHSRSHIVVNKHSLSKGLLLRWSHSYLVTCHRFWGWNSEKLQVSVMEFLAVSLSLPATLFCRTFPSTVGPQLPGRGADIQLEVVPDLWFMYQGPRGCTAPGGVLLRNVKQQTQGGSRGWWGLQGRSWGAEEALGANSLVGTWWEWEGRSQRERETERGPVSTRLPRGWASQKSV